MPGFREEVPAQEDSSRAESAGDDVPRVAPDQRRERAQLRGREGEAEEGGLFEQS